MNGAKNQMELRGARRESFALYEDVKARVPWDDVKTKGRTFVIVKVVDRRLGILTLFTELLVFSNCSNILLVFTSLRRGDQCDTNDKVNVQRMG